MRFEIRAGGAILVLAGLGVLSGAVFVLGLIAGEEMAREQARNAEVAQVYQLPPSPAPEVSPAIAAQPLACPSAAPVAAAPEEAPAAEATPAQRAAEPEAATTAEAAVATPKPKRRPYSVQIEAVMDRNGAEQMVGKLKQLGYQSYIVETEIDGQTWYRVRIGPFGSEAEARDAETKLHERYSGAFTTR